MPPTNVPSLAGTPIAVLCEEEAHMPAAAAAARQGLAGVNVYDDAALRRAGLQQRVQLMDWQSYLKEEDAQGGGGSGCM